MILNDEELKQWVEERDRVIKSYDVEAFKAFYRKYQEKGLYTMPTPSDEVIKISMRKAVLGMASATGYEIAEAASWLVRHGYRADF